MFDNGNSIRFLYFKTDIDISFSKRRKELDNIAKDIRLFNTFLIHNHWVNARCPV